MSKKKKKKKNKPSHSVRRRPEKFNNFSECLKWIKKSVYVVVRGKNIEINGQQAVNWVTLGTGFIVAPNRFVTASHVINNQKSDNKNNQHQDGDKYYLLRHDDEGAFHYHIFEPKINKEIFLYSDIDLAILYLNDEFYQSGDKVFADKNEFIRVSKDFCPIGSQIGVLGYPLSQLKFENADLAKPLIGNILLRTDLGVINCRYQQSEDKYCYEFTLAFNPGNSGGPIFDVKTGRLLSIVKGYKSIPINNRELIIPPERLKELKKYKEESFIETIHATYSLGFATPTFLSIFREHGIIN